MREEFSSIYLPFYLNNYLLKKSVRYFKEERRDRYREAYGNQLCVCQFHTDTYCS